MQVYIYMSAHVRCSDRRIREGQAYPFLDLLVLLLYESLSQHGNHRVENRISRAYECLEILGWVTRNQRVTGFDSQTSVD